MFTDKAVVIS